MKLLFASPTHSDVPPRVVIGQRTAIMHAANNAGVTWVGDLSPDDVKLTTIDVARNRMVHAAREKRPDEPGYADAIFWCDSDIELPAHAITNLVQSGKEFVTGIYCQRYPPYFPVIGRYDRDCNGANWIVEWDQTQPLLYPIDLCGFGCVLTSLALLRRMQAPYFAFTTLSEDFTFCRQAMDLGVQLFVDTGVECTHVGPRSAVRVDDFRREWAQEHSSPAQLADGSAA